MYVVAYDISDDRIRDRTATAILGFGIRVQKSVFECDIGPPELEELIESLVRALEDPANGSIRIYRLCGNCQADAVGLGTAVPTLGSDGMYLA